MRIDFDQTAYEVVEDAGSIEVCGTLSGPDIEQNLMVLLITSDVTAQGNYASSRIITLLSYHVLPQLMILRVGIEFCHSLQMLPLRVFQLESLVITWWRVMNYSVSVYSSKPTRHLLN